MKKKKKILYITLLFNIYLMRIMNNFFEKSLYISVSILLYTFSKNFYISTLQFFYIYFFVQIFLGCINF